MTNVQQDVSMNSLRQRLDALFDKKLFTNSFVENFKGKKKKKGRGKKKKSKKKARKSKKKQSKSRDIETKGRPFLQKEFGFTYVTQKSLTTAKGWRNVFNIFFFIIPALIMFIADKIVNIEILKSKKYDPIDALKYKKYKENDKLWIYNSGIEFFQIFIAAYIASSFYHMIFIERHRDMETYFRQDVDKHIGVDMCTLVLFGFIFLPRLFYFIIYKTVFKPEENDEAGNSSIKTEQGPVKNPTINAFGFLSDLSNFFSATKPPTTSGGIGVYSFENKSQHNTEETFKGLLPFLPYKDSRTSIFLLFYCFSFFICSFFLSKLATLFLDVFIFKANPIMYIFILLAFLQWAIQTIGKMFIHVTLNEDGTETIKVPNPQLYFMFSIMYVIYLFFHMLFALGFAPVAQAIFTIYLLSFMINMNKLADVKNWTVHIPNFINDFKSSKVKNELDDYNTRPTSTKTNGFLHKYIFQNNKLMFSFLFMIFFLWKFLTTFIPGVGLKIHGLYAAFAIINFLIAILCFNIYLKFYTKYSLWKLITNKIYNTADRSQSTAPAETIPNNITNQGDRSQYTAPAEKVLETDQVPVSAVGNGVGHQGTGLFSFIGNSLTSLTKPRS